MRFLLFMSLFIFSSLTYAINAKLSCKVFVNAMPKADLEIAISGKNPVKDSTTIAGKSGKFRAELSWEGYFEEVPLNPEMRIQYLAPNETVVLEAYKIFDLHKYEKENPSVLSENDDNIGVRTADEVVYLSCDYINDHR